MEYIASFGLNLAAFGFVGFLALAFFSKNHPPAYRVFGLLIGGSILIAIFHKELGLMMLVLFLAIALLREP